MPVNGSIGSISSVEQDVIYSNAELICVDNGGVKTTQYVRQRTVVNNSTGLEGAPVTEYSADGATWSTTVPTGTITAGACAIANPTDTVTAPTRVASSAAGATTANAFSVSIVNVGAANGSVQGVPLLPGESVSYVGYHDVVAGVVRRLPAIAYDGTGTVIHIVEQA